MNFLCAKVMPFSFVSLMTLIKRSFSYTPSVFRLSLVMIPRGDAKCLPSF